MQHEKWLENGEMKTFIYYIPSALLLDIALRYTYIWNLKEENLTVIIITYFFTSVFKYIICYCSRSERKRGTMAHYYAMHCSILDKAFEHSLNIFHFASTIYNVSHDSHYSPDKL